MRAKQTFGREFGRETACLRYNMAHAIPFSHGNINIFMGGMT